MIKVKCTGADLPIIEQTDNGLWGDCRFYWNDTGVKECDYWFLFDGYGLDKDNTAICPKENIYIVMGEADEYKTYNRNFLKQFYNLITVQRDRYDATNIQYKYLAPWFVGFRFVGGIAEKKHYKSFNRLCKIGSNINKTKLLSIVSSNKQMNEGHRQRLLFAAMVKNYFGDQVDFFGRGINEFEDKWDVLAPYKYHIAIENQVCDDYITEKFYDPLLAMSYPIYHGARNIDKYFDKRCFAKIDIYQPEKAIKVIESVIRCNSYEYFHDQLVEARELVLNKYNVFNEISEIIKNDRNDHSLPEMHCIHPEYEFLSQITGKKLINEDVKESGGTTSLPKVTVAIPTYNRKEYLKKAMDSIISQDYPNLELVVSDNDSSDGTGDMVKEYCKRYDNVVYYRQKENVGAKLNWKKCLELASGKYCLILSDDDILEEGAITCMVNAFFDGVSVVIGNTVHIDENDNIVGGHENPPGILSEREYWEARLTKWYHDTPSGVLYLTKNGREAFAKVADQLETAMDMAMDLVMSKQGNVHCIPDKVVKYRIHSGNDSNNIMRCASSHIGLYEVLKDTAPTIQCREMLHYYCRRTILEHVWKAIEGNQVAVANQCLGLLDKLKP